MVKYKIGLFLLISYQSLISLYGAFGLEKVDKDLVGDKTLLLGTYVQAIIVYLVGFFALIAVIMGIWGGFQILTASGDEDKVKKGKRSLGYALLGLVVVILAWTIAIGVTGGLETVEKGSK